MRTFKITQTTPSGAGNRSWLFYPLKDSIDDINAEIRETLASDALNRWNTYGIGDDEVGRVWTEDGELRTDWIDTIFTLSEYRFDWKEMFECAECGEEIEEPGHCAECEAEKKTPSAEIE